MNLKDYLHRASYAKSLEELWAAHTEQMALFGFDRLLYGYTRFRTERSLSPALEFFETPLKT